MPQSAVAGWAERAWVGLIRVAPLRTYTRLIRAVAGIPLPRNLRSPVFGTVAQRMGIDLAEAAGEVAEYRCFQELFVRSLREGLRPVDLAHDALVSPVDGIVSRSGVATRGGMIQAKGIEYPLAELVGSEDLARALDGGVYLTLYLRPRDYHRIHSPISGRVVRVRRIPGHLYPVKPYMVRGLRGLYVRNERLVLELETALGRVGMVCVAAAGVGNITTALADGKNGTHSSRPDVSVDKGGEVACFNLGSTVIVVFPPRRVELAPLALGETVRMGQRVASVVPGE